MTDERYDMRMPLASNALDLFGGQWSHQVAGFESPNLPRFYEDPRIRAFDGAIGGFGGKTVLELGPLEAGHTFMMEAFGAASILAVEANKTAFMKCLIVKELLGLPKTRFMLGDFNKLLQFNPPRVDAVVASGVLYHMTEPLALIENMARCSDYICVWTHYFSPEVRWRADLRDKFSPRDTTVDFHGRQITLCEQSYHQAVKWGGFCGGSEATSYWITRDGIVQAFDALGFDFKVLGEEPNHPNGPAITFVAQRRR
ncbi:MAG TPA: class I SAM-dependent methyltransferase [Xanthobacteraceae bacterium]|nr:class I SAM-dependent methyltransferase [Xanthobacteraceae bacterium]